MGNELLSVLREYFAALSSSAHLRENACSLTTEIRAQREASRPCTDPMEESPELYLVLDALAADIDDCPSRLQVIDSCLLTRIRSLVGHVDIDLNSPLSPDDE
ncbi:putative regulator PrlF [compost metagenome]